MRELETFTLLEPAQVGLSYEWSEDERTSLSLRIVRRERAYPTSPGDGMVVLAEGMLTSGPGTPLLTWTRAVRLCFRVDVAPGSAGSVRLELRIGFDDAGNPRQAWLEDAGAGRQVHFDALVGAATEADPSDPALQRLDLLRLGSGGPEAVLSLSVQWTAEPGQRRVRIETPDHALDVELTFDELHLEYIKRDDAASLTLPEGQVRGRWRARQQATTDLASALAEPSAHAGPGLRIELDEELQVDQGAWRRRLRLADVGLGAETIQYYRLFAAGAQTPRSPDAARVSALATGAQGLVAYSHRSLPAHLRLADEPTPEAQPSDATSGGPLRRFLELFGMALDRLQGSAQALGKRHDLDSAPASFLPALSRQIGWVPDFTVSELRQRRDIRFAPELFSTVGTLNNARSLVHRATGWPCHTKEYVHNVMLTNAVEAISLWDIWSMAHDGSNWGAPAIVSPTPPSRGESLDPFSGRPALVVDDAGVLHTFWHSQADSGWDIWQKVGAGVAVRALPASDEQRTNPCALLVGVDLWLLWDQGAESRRDIWLRRGSDAPERVTDHPAEDSRPSAVLDASGKLWVFWQSARRGFFDIWVRVLAGSGWEGEARRLTTSVAPDIAPCAVRDAAGDLHVFWTRDEGARRVLLHIQRPAAASGHPGQGWSAEAPVFASEHAASLDADAPAAVLAGGELQLFWHANAGGRRSRLWSSRRSVTGFDEPVALTEGLSEDREPAAAIAAGRLTLAWRSQRRGRAYVSRTFEPSMRAERDTLADRAHYTFDTRRTPEARYGRAIVGVFVDPGGASPEEIEHGLRVAASSTETFRPANARFCWLTEATPPGGEQ